MPKAYSSVLDISLLKTKSSGAFVISFLISSSVQEPWRGLDAAVADVIEPEMPGVTIEILESIGREIPEYARPLEGAFGRGVRRGTDEALQQFVGLIRNPDADRRRSRRVYVILGRGEFMNGRSLDSLQSAYRIGARIAWRRIAAASLDAGLGGKTLSLLAESIFVYIDELSADSTEGYAIAQFRQQGTRLRRERQLVNLMLSDPAPETSEIETAARAAAWEIPKSLAALACHERDLVEISRILPIGVISATVDGYTCLVLPDPNAPGRLKQISDAIGHRFACQGSEVRLGRLSESWSLARTAFEAGGSGYFKASGLVRAEEHLVDLALFNSRDLIRQLRSRTTRPLDGLTPKAKERMVETALAYIEERGNASAMARTLDIHPQTARYRIARLREIFGEELDRPDDRLALELSLRAR
ncbi:MAG: helix-turn-helix domain-containing protein [Solirubrobacterales bacterium]|nr:helix-turn-helix domain-containing protein [Solirubrobacterales bacterium]